MNSACSYHEAKTELHSSLQRNRGQRVAYMRVTENTEEE